MKMMITISGKAQHGKDTTATILKEKLENQGYKVLIIHFADYLKFVCEKYLGWDGVKDEKGRELLQRVGTDVVREKYPNFWVDIAKNLSLALGDQFDYFLFPDCRFPSEIEAFKNSNIPHLSVKIFRTMEDGSAFDNGLTEKQKMHQSECALDDYRFDYFINNVGDKREFLSEQIDDMMKNYL